MSKCKWVVRGVSARAHPFGCIIQRFRKLLQRISCSIYLSLHLIFFSFFFFFFSMRCFSLSIPRNTLFFLPSFSHSGPLCFARISRCITVVIACRDCLQLSERMSVRLCTTLAVSLSLSRDCISYFFIFFLLFPPPPELFFVVSLITDKKEDWWRN